MDPIVYLVIGLVLGVVVGYFVGKSRNTGNGDNELAIKLATAEGNVTALTAQIAEAKREREAKELKEAQENRILVALEPLKTNLKSMEDKVTELEKSRHQQFGTVEEQLRVSLQESQKLSKQTETLAKAMSDSKMRGTWGEVQLRRLIEEAGLINLADFLEQKGDGDGQRPDVTLRLPGGKHILIDSKVPFDAYMEASGISDLGTKEELAKRDELLEKHAGHVRSHVKKLGAKEYWNGVTDSPPFVIAYIPSESLLAAALHADPKLLEDAFKSGVAIASPVSLFSVLKTVTYIWRQETNEKALANVIKLGKEIYARVGVVAKHAAALGKSIDETVGNYNSFASSLERNLLTAAKDSNKYDETQFGSADIKELPMIDTPTEAFKKPELTAEIVEAEVIESDEA